VRALLKLSSSQSVGPEKKKKIRGGENPLTTGVKQAVPYRNGREAWYLSVSTE